MTTAIAQDIDHAVLIHADDQATRAANGAITAMMLKHGEELWACGFAWVTYPEKVRRNSQMGKALEAIGFRYHDYYKRFEKWNPGEYAGQSVDAAAAGADAYREVFKALTGLEKVYASSRLD